MTAAWMRSRRVGAAYAVAGLLGAGATLGASGSLGSGDEPFPYPFETAIAATAEIATSVTAVGWVIPAEQVRVSSEITGRIFEVDVAEGSLVRRGETMVRVDAAVSVAAQERAAQAVGAARAGVVRAAAELEQAERDYRRQHQLSARGSSPAEALELAQLRLERARAAVVIAEAVREGALAGVEREAAQTNRATIRAPITGVVRKLFVRPGEVVAAGSPHHPGTPVLTLMSPDRFGVSVLVPEETMRLIAAGSRAYITVDAFPNHRLGGSVQRVGLGAATVSTFGGSSRHAEYQVLIRLDSTDLPLRPQMTAVAAIETGRHRVGTSIPIAGLLGPSRRDVNQGERPLPRVLVLRDGRPEFVGVEPGTVGDSLVEVRRGLKLGDTVVVGPWQLLDALQQRTTPKVEALAPPTPRRAP